MISSKRKIIFVNRYFYPDISATSQMLSGIAFGLVDSGNEIHVVTNRFSYDNPNNKFASKEIVENVYIHRIWTSNFGRASLFCRSIDYFTFYIFSFLKLIVLAKKNDIVIAKTDPPLISVICFMVCRLKGSILINWLQDLFPEVAKVLDIKMPSYIYRILVNIRNKTLYGAEKNIVIGYLMKDKVLKLGVMKDKIVVIENYADPEYIYPVKHKNNSLRKKWGLMDKFVIGYSGNLGRSHDFSSIIEAARMLKKNKDIVFLFIGEGSQKKIIQDISNIESLNIIFKSYQPTNKIAESLSVADVHLVTLKPELEGLIVPSKIYGIISSGKKILFLGAKNSEASRIINTYELGYVLDPSNAEKIKDKILFLSQKKLIEDGVKIKELDEYFSKKISISKFISLIKN